MYHQLAQGVSTAIVFFLIDQSFLCRTLSNWVSWIEFDWDDAQTPNEAGLRGTIPWLTGRWYGRNAGDWYVRGGFGSIPEYISQTFRDRILFNERVLSIDYGSNSVFVSTNTGVYEADQVCLDIYYLHFAHKARSVDHLCVLPLSHSFVL